MSLLQDLVNLFADLFSDLVLYSYFVQDRAYWVALSVIAFLGLLVVLFTLRYRQGQLPILRGIEGVFDLERNVLSAAEAGKTVHVSVGTGSLGDLSTVQTTAGIDVLREVSFKSAISGPPVIATTSSALSLPVVETTVRDVYAEASSGVGFEADNNRFIAPTPVAYAAGVMRVINSENVGLNVMVGAFGDEYLLMGETGAARGAKQMVAAADPSVLPFVIATADHPIIGEELFALSAYLRPLPARLASIMAQDIVRLIIVVLILILVITVSIFQLLGFPLSGGSLGR